jgi:hypothetical protein
VDGVDKCVAFDPPGSWYNNAYEAIMPGRVDKVTTYESKYSAVSAVGTASGEYHQVEITGDPFHHDISLICEALGGRDAIEKSWNRA